MRRSIACFRGAKGRGWYSHYRSNPEDFAKFTSPTPFDWSKPSPTAIDPSVVAARPKAFFEVISGGEVFGKLEFELAHDVVPKTVDNFIKLIEGTGKNPALSYKGSKFHQVRKGQVIMGGDVETKDGTNSHSAFEQRFFGDENFIIPHSARGLISMATVGVNTNGSQFYISLSPTQYLNGRCVVFGRLVGGEDVLARMEKVFTYKGVPATDLVIQSCGVTKK